jgi:hypothetical protein
VYIYVDAAIRSIRIQGEHFSIPDDAATLEVFVINSLKKAKTRAAALLGAARHPSPRFIFIGVQDLVLLFNSLGQMDPLLLRRIAGTKAFYTYDSPKLVEAVIRIARSLEPYLAQYAVIRIDEDVLPNEEAIELLLAKAHEKWRSLTKYFFFSGGYCGPQDPDSFHEHAVRTHWLEKNGPGVCSFLGDLGEIGAVQICATKTGQPAEPGHCPTTSANDVPRSDLGDSLAQKRRALGVPDRQSPQVISGAGLVMSTSCILELPPFMISHLVVWVDDHLKRRLHEQVGHIEPTATERILGARFLQEREAARDFAYKDYFERLLRGCLMHALIVSENGKQGPLSHAVELAVKGRLKRASHGAGERLLGRANRRANMVSEFMKPANIHGEAILNHWKGSEVAYGDDLLASWAQEKLKTPSGEGVPAWEAIRDSLVDDAFDYLVLVTEWSDYVRAIQRLRFVAASWLFETPDP